MFARILTLFAGEEEDSGRSSWSEETESEASAPSSLSEEYVDRQWPTSFLTQFKVSLQLLKISY